MKTLQRYQCEICEEVYDTQAEAESCEAIGREEPVAKVGDFVITEMSFGRFGWFDGDPAWVIVRDKDFQMRPGKTYSVIYVVTAVDNHDPFGRNNRKHELCYHLATKAMSGEKGYGAGYTFIETHVGLHKIEANLDGTDLIGRLAKCLI